MGGGAEEEMGGDARSTAFNPIRDTIFASNPELYYKIGNTATMLTVLSLPVGMSMEAAVAVGGSPLRAGITELGKFGISTIAGEVTTDKVTEWTGSEALGIIAGMGTSSLSYGGLSAADYKVNISGLHGTGGNTRIGNVTGSGKGGSGSIGEGIESGSGSKPYTNSRPSYGKNQVNEVWENAKDPITGKVYDPSGVEITWDKTKPRNGQWDMGHIPGEKYSEMHQLYMDDVISKDEFLEWYRNPKNYRPELPNTNRSHKYE